MDLDDAAHMLRQTPALAMSEIRASLATRYAGSPQKATAVDLAHQEIEHGLSVLAQHGHKYSLVEDPGVPVEQFPTMVYKANAGHLLATNQAELDTLLGDGWSTSPTGGSTDQAAAVVEQQAPAPEPEPEPVPEPVPEPAVAPEPSVAQ